MTLAAVLENLDDVPETLKDEYTQGEDGKFHLDLDDSIRTHTSIAALTRSLANAKKEKQTLQTTVADLKEKVRGVPEDFDRAEYDRLVEEEAQRKKDPNYKGADKDADLARQREQYDQRIASMQSDFEAKLAEKDAVIQTLDGEIVGDKAEVALSTGLVKAGIAPEFMDGVTALLRRQVKVVKDDESGERRAIVETDLGEVSVDKYIETWSKSDQGKPYVAKGQGSGAPGSGKPGSSEVNPWAKETRNLTQQGEVIRADKVKAERMMKAAGISPDQISRALGR